MLDRGNGATAGRGIPGSQALLEGRDRVETARVASATAGPNPLSEPGADLVRLAGAASD